MFRYVFIVAASIIITEATVKLEVTNEEIGLIWVGIKSEPGKAVVENGGFELQSTETKILNVPDNWAGRLWARTWCDPGSKHCLTGDCGNKLKCGRRGGAPPATTVEISLKAHRGVDYYDVTLVDGFNIGASVQPENGVGNGGNLSCKPASCMHEFKRDCPTELRLNSPHGVLGCKSPCQTFKTDEYCCRGVHKTPSTCKSDTWENDYAAMFKKECPDAFSYIFDKDDKTFTCRADHYIITFGGAF
ncbi:unnamed protein product [Phaedon cochleariae]|uniref:Thaumatin-like protein n=1 Tax=Phaedon cochleariae TaxID=80249 RepID=A0A9P0DA75_PHACE|nr:unnamed protein product [Phaedon cochleariae]